MVASPVGHLIVPWLHANHLAYAESSFAKDDIHFCHWRMHARPPPLPLLLRGILTRLLCNCLQRMPLESHQRRLPTRHSMRHQPLTQAVLAQWVGVTLQTLRPNCEILCCSTHRISLGAHDCSRGGKTATVRPAHPLSGPLATAAPPAAVILPVMHR